MTFSDAIETLAVLCEKLSMPWAICLSVIKICSLVLVSWFTLSKISCELEAVAFDDSIMLSKPLSSERALSQPESICAVPFSLSRMRASEAF